MKAGTRTCDGVGLGVLLTEGGVAQVTEVLKTAPDVQIGHQAGGRRKGRVRGAGSLPNGRHGQCLHGQGLNSRPLAEVAMQRQPAGLGADLKGQLGTPGGSREHAEEAL